MRPPWRALACAPCPRRSARDPRTPQSSQASAVRRRRSPPRQTWRPCRLLDGPQTGRARGSVPRPCASPGTSLTPGRSAPGEVTLPWPDALPRKEVIQPQLPLRLPCYDFVPITSPALDGCLSVNGVSPPASGVTGFRDVTGGVYKAREHIHRGTADPRLLATPASRGRVAAHDPN